MGFGGGMAEWSKAAVLKTVDRKVRGFESYSLRQGFSCRDRPQPCEEALRVGPTGGDSGWRRRGGCGGEVREWLKRAAC